MKQSPLGSSEPIVDVVVGIGKELGKRSGDATREVTEVSTTEAYGHTHTHTQHTHNTHTQALSHNATHKQCTGTSKNTHG